MRILIKSLEISKRNLSEKTFSSGCYKKRKKEKKRFCHLTQLCALCCVCCFDDDDKTGKASSRQGVCLLYIYVHSHHAFFAHLLFYWGVFLVVKVGWQKWGVTTFTWGVCMVCDHFNALVYMNILWIYIGQAQFCYILCTFD